MGRKPNIKGETKRNETKEEKEARGIIKSLMAEQCTIQVGIYPYLLMVEELEEPDISVDVEAIKELYNNLVRYIIVEQLPIGQSQAELLGQYVMYIVISKALQRDIFVYGLRKDSKAGEITYNKAYSLYNAYNKELKSLASDLGLTATSKWAMIREAIELKKAMDEGEHEEVVENSIVALVNLTTSIT